MAKDTAVGILYPLQITMKDGKKWKFRVYIDFPSLKIELKPIDGYHTSFEMSQDKMRENLRKGSFEVLFSEGMIFD